MNADDLGEILKGALRGANVTINVQGGTGNTMYTAPVQINNNRTGARRAIRPPSVCNICGKTADGGDIFYHFVGWSHQDCIDRQGEEARRLRAQRQAGLWQIVKSTPNELPEAPRQLSAASIEQDELDPQEQWDMYALEYLLSK